MKGNQILTKLLQFENNNMIKKLLPFQQDQNKTKNNADYEMKEGKLKFKSSRQIQSKQLNQYPQHYNIYSATKINDHISKSPIIESKFADKYIQITDEQQQKFLLQIGGYFSQSQNKSQVISINELEQYQPIMMSNINFNLKRNFRLLSHTKIKNSIQELRSIQIDFLDYINDQRTFLNTEIKKMADHLLKKMKVQTPTLPTAEQMQQLFQKNKTIASLESKIQQKDQQISKLKKEIISNKLMLQRQQQKSKQLQKLNTRKLTQRSNTEYQNCQNCKILQIKYNTLKQELAQFQEIKSMNEQLQQYIFDIEQKIVGIDIEVQRRVTQHVKAMDQSSASKHKKQSNREQSQNYIQILRKLNDQNASLQEKCDRLERNTIKQNQLLQFQRKLMEKQMDYQRKQNQFFQSLAKHEKDKENLYQRQHYILISQETISNKIQQINQKQAQLSQWQSMLINQIELPNNILPSIQRREEMQQQNNYQMDENAINSFGKIQQEQYVNRYDQSKNQLERNLSHNVFIPELQIHKDQTYPYIQRNYQRKLERQNILTTQQSPKSAHQPTNKVYAQILKKQQNKLGNYNMKKKYQIQLNQKMSHRERSNQALSKSPKNYWQSSKSSKISPAKSIRNNYLQTYSSNQKIGLRQNTQGLTNKLDRLREQIKREIKSIV